MARTWWVGSLLRLACACAVGCGDDDVPPPMGEAPRDPFVAGASLELEVPARDVAVVVSGAKPLVALARELAGDVLGVHGGPAGLETGEAVVLGGGPRRLTALDADGAGEPDLAVADTGGGRVVVLRGTVDGDLGPGEAVDLGAPAVALAALDVDADGTLELAVVAGLEDEGRVELRRAAGLVPVGLALPVPGASAVSAGDIGGDGELDLAVVVGALGRVVLLRAGGGALVEGGDGFACDLPTASAIADVDGDGRGDLLASCTGEVALRIGEQRRSLPAGGALYDLVARDLDGDGATDVAAVDVTEHALLVWMAPRGVAASPSLHVTARGPIALDAGDADGDGDLDLLVLSYEERLLQIFENAGPAAASTPR